MLDILPNGDEAPGAASAPLNPFSCANVIAILSEKGRIAGDPDEKQLVWCARAAALLGPQSADLTALSQLLELVFRYDAHAVLQTIEAHVVMSRYAARDVLRRLALLLLDGTELTTDRFRVIIDQLKSGLDIRGRELFHPLRLVLAGRSGEGELDRVILLLDDAASAGFAVPVKTARERILEFCAALD